MVRFDSQLKPASRVSPAHGFAAQRCRNVHPAGTDLASGFFCASVTPVTAHPDLDRIDNCALAAALDMMGERWSFLILRAAFNGIRHFEDFQASLGIARNILANRLARLVSHGILTREASEDDRRRVIYTLTQKGEGLVPAMIALRQWGELWGEGELAGPVLCDRRDRLPVRPVVIQAADGRTLTRAELCWGPPPEAGSASCARAADGKA